MVKLKEESYSIPIENVSMVIRVENYHTSNLLYQVEEKLILKHQNELISLLDLQGVLYKSTNRNLTNDINIVIVSGEDFKYGIIVDEILDIEEIVVRKLSKHFNTTNTFMGVTNIGTNGLALILNLSAIAKLSNLRTIDDELEVNVQPIPLFKNETHFMQFNLKNCKNYAISLNTVYRLEEFSADAIESSGDISLIRYRGEVMPIIFIEQQLSLNKTTQSLSENYPEKLKVIVINQKSKKFGIVVDEILDIGSTTTPLNGQNIDREGIIGTVFIGDKTITVLDTEFLTDTFIPFKLALAA